jgi:nitronate monooxygenase
MTLLETLGIDLPIIQAPMAGTSTPALAAAVSNAGALGSLGFGSSSVEVARTAIHETRALTQRPFNVNLFCHLHAEPDPARDAAWLDALAPEYRRFGAEPPPTLREINVSFRDNAAMRTMLLEERPAMVSFHFGLPSEATIRALREAGMRLLASVTSLSEARQIESAGLDAVIAQGIEAGGHRGVFDPSAPDEALPTATLTRLLVRETRLPVIAAGGIMDGAGIAAVLALGAQAAQLGTAFVVCPEAATPAGNRALIFSPAAEHTVLTAAVSGRPARGIVNRFETLDKALIPAYPYAYDAGQKLIAAARAAGSTEYVAQWVGQGAPMARALPAAELVALLRQEWEQARI